MRCFLPDLIIYRKGFLYKEVQSKTFCSPVEEISCPPDENIYHWKLYNSASNWVQKYAQLFLLDTICYEDQFLVA